MAWRLYTTYESSKTTDWSYIIVTTALQSHLELWLGMMAANLPMMGHLLKKGVSGVSSTIRMIRSPSGNLSNESRSTQSWFSGLKISRNSKKRARETEEGFVELPLGQMGAQYTDDNLELGENTDDGY
jgi:hypothetical protein